MAIKKPIPFGSAPIGPIPFDSAPIVPIQPVSNGFNQTNGISQPTGTDKLPFKFPQMPGFKQRVGGVINKAGQDVYNSVVTDTTGNPIRRGFEATATAFNTVPQVAFQALPEQARNTLGGIGGGIGSGFKMLTDQLAGTPAFEKLAYFSQRYPEASKALEDVLATASAAGQIAGDIITIDQGTKALQKTAEIGAKTVSKAGQGVQKVGEKLYKSAYTPTADEARFIQSNQAKVKFLTNELNKVDAGTPEYKALTEQLKTAKANAPTLASDTALRRGIAGTEKQIGVQSNVERLDIWKNKIEPALKNSKDTINKQELFAKAEQRVASEVDPSRQASFQNALDSLKEDYANINNTDLLKANQLKTSLDKFTPTKIFKGQDVASELKTLKADMADAIREKTYSSLSDEGIKAAYRDYGNLKQLEQVGIKALTSAGKKGGFGNFWSTLYEQGTVPVKTVGGKVLYRVGNKLEFLGEKGVETLGQHLENIGAGLKLNGVNMQGGYIKNPFATSDSPMLDSAGKKFATSPSGELTNKITQDLGMLNDVDMGIVNPTTGLVDAKWAKGRINDFSDSLNGISPGMGNSFKSSFDLPNYTPEAFRKITDKAIELSKTAPSGSLQGNVNSLLQQGGFGTDVAKNAANSVPDTFKTAPLTAAKLKNLQYEVDSALKVFSKLDMGGNIVDPSIALDVDQILGLKKSLQKLSQSLKK